MPVLLVLPAVMHIEEVEGLLLEDPTKMSPDTIIPFVTGAAPVYPMLILSE